MVFLPGHCLSVDDVFEAVELVVEEVDVSRQVEEAEEFVLGRESETAALAVRHVLGGLIHPSVGAALPVDALHHVRGRPVVGAHEQRVRRPRAQVVE